MLSAIVLADEHVGTGSANAVEGAEYKPAVAEVDGQRPGILALAIGVEKVRNQELHCRRFRSRDCS